MNMIAELLLIDSTSSPDAQNTQNASKTIPDAISAAFDPQYTLITKFTNIGDLTKYLLTLPNYILKQSDSNTISRVYNKDEEELYYPIGLLFNSEMPPLELSHLNIEQTLSHDILKLLFEKRFHHLNIIIDIIPFSCPSLSNFKSNLQLIYPLINQRLLRIKTWVGLNAEDLSLEKQSQLKINSMVNTLNDDADGSSNSNDSDLIHSTYKLFNDVDYKSLLIINHEDQYYLDSVNKWGFPAYQLTSDELLYSAFLMFKQISDQLTNSKEELEHFNNSLIGFLFNIRDNYRYGNPFHNFRHAIDVTQGTNYFMNELSKDSSWKVNFTPLNKFALLLASVGHDLGHPGITNAFLTNFKSPVAIKLNNSSVLEKYHLNQLKQIISNYVCVVNTNETIEESKILIRKSVLATDMANHDLYVKEIDQFLNYKDDKQKLEMLSCLLLKCADISNVCRPLEVSVKWGLSLGQEFKELAFLEKLLKYESNVTSIERPSFNLKTLKPDDAIKFVPTLSGSQMFFINRFALDFFNKIGENIPALLFLKEQLQSNAEYWQQDIENQKKSSGSSASS